MIFLVTAIVAVATQVSPQAAVDQLIAADREFGEAATTLAPADAFARMLDADAAMATGGRQYFGRDAVLAALRASPNYRGTGMRWAPIRGGISADGTHGFTFGYAEIEGGDPARRLRKYLAYWVKRPEGWRVLAYAGGFRGEGNPATAMLPPSLPGFTVEPRDDAASLAAHRASLAAAEQAFSDMAQRVGLRAAFSHYVRLDGMLLGDTPEIRIGHAAVIAQFPPAATSPVRWSTDRAYVASSGDLGLSIGTIRQNQPVEGQPATIPYFTVWRRDTPSGEWRFIAE